PFLVRLVKAELVAPRARRLDISVVLLAVEFCVRKFILGLAETLAKLLERRNNKADMAAQHIRVTGRQMELALADIDPHVVGAREHKGVASQAQRGQVKLGRQPLIVDSKIDVFKTDEVTEILSRTIVGLLCHQGPPKLSTSRCRSAMPCFGV